ncbi:MAG: hypothetical protein U1E50_18685 [Caulobacteraceae bacterium]
MILVEVLVAGAVLAGAAALFLAIVIDAGADLGRARMQSRQVALGSAILRQARATWPQGPRQGVAADLSWRLTCPDLDETQGRLVLVTCKVTVAAKDGLYGGTRTTLSTAWAAPRPEASLP